MKNERCPNCGQILKGSLDACPNCGFEFTQTKNRPAKGEYEEIDDAFARALKTQAERKRIIDEAQSLAKSDFGKADALFRKALAGSDAPYFAAPYLSFLLDATRNEKDLKGMAPLFQGYAFLKGRSLLDALDLDGDPICGTAADSLKDAFPYWEVISFVNLTLAKKGLDCRGLSAADALIAHKFGEPFDSFAAVALLSKMYKASEGDALDEALARFTKYFDFSKFFLLSRDPIAVTILRPFLNFYIQCAQKKRSGRIEEGAAEKRKERQSKIRLEEESFRKQAKAKSKYKSLTDAKIEFIDAKGVDEPRFAMEALKKGKPFQLRNITFGVLDSDGNAANVAFLFPFRIPYDADAKIAIFGQAKSGLTKWKEKVSAVLNHESTAFDDLINSTVYGKDSLGRHKMRDTSFLLYDKSSIRLILNNAIWNELPPGLGKVFEPFESGDLFALMYKQELSSALKKKAIPSWNGRMPAWAGSDCGGKALVYDGDDRYICGAEYSWACVKATIKIREFEKWANDTESFLSKTFLD